MSVIGNLGYKINRYLSVGGDQNVNGADQCYNDWENFEVVRNRNGKFGFVNVHHGTYLSAQKNGRLRCDRTWNKPWEQFKVKVIIENEQKHDNDHDDDIKDVQQQMNMDQNDEIKTANQQKDDIMNVQPQSQEVPSSPHPHYPPPTCNYHQNNQDLPQNNVNNYDQDEEMKNNMNTNNNQQRENNSPFMRSLPAQYIEMNRDEVLQTINQHNKPSNGQQDRFECIEHGASINSGKDIKSCLKHLLDEDQLSVSGIADELETVYKYSCIVWEDSDIFNRQIDARGIKGAVSTWLLTNEHGTLVARYQILIVSGLKIFIGQDQIEMNHYTERKNSKSCLSNLWKRNKLNATAVAERLEEDYNYSCFVYEDINIKSFSIDYRGLRTLGFSKPVYANDNYGSIAKYTIMIVHGQKRGMKNGPEV